MNAMFGIRNLLLIYLQIDWTLLEARERERERVPLLVQYIGLVFVYANHTKLINVRWDSVVKASIIEKPSNVLMKCNESDMNIYYKVIFENIYLTYIS